MRDLVILQNSLLTTFKFRYSYIKKYMEMGGRVFIIAPNDSNDAKRELLEIGCEIVRIPKFNGMLSKFLGVFLINFKLIYLRFKLNNPLVVCHFLLTYIVSFISLNLFYSKFVISIEGLGSIFLKRKSLLNIIRLLMARKNIVRIFCNSDERDKIGNIYDFVSKGIGVDLNKFSFVDSKHESTSFNIIYVGRLISDKGILDAVSVLEMLKDFNAKLIVVGDIYPNNPTSLTENDIINLKGQFGDRISFEGYVSDPRIFYDQADILILPSKREGFPVCVMEANSKGVPVLCYNVPGCIDAIDNGVNGYLVDYGDIEKMRDIIIGLYQNQDVFNKIRLSSRQYAEINFDEKVKINEFLNIITRL